MKPLLILTMGTFIFGHSALDAPEVTLPRVLTGRFPENPGEPKRLVDLFSRSGRLPLKERTLEESFTSGTSTLETAWFVTWHNALVNRSHHSIDNARIRFLASRYFIALDYAIRIHVPTPRLGDLIRVPGMDRFRAQNPDLSDRVEILPIFARNGGPGVASRHDVLAARAHTREELPLLLDQVPGVDRSADPLIVA